MPRLRFGLLSGFKFQSILTRTLALLFVLIFITVGSVYWLFRGLVTQRYRDASRNSQQLLLSRISSSVDSIIARTHRSMNRLFADQNVTGLMISPARYDYERLTGVMDSVFQLADGDAMVRQAYLYVFGNDMVYTSDGEIGSILENEDKKPIIACLTATRQINLFLIEGREVGLLEYEGRMLLFQKYPDARPSGLVVVELDTDRFYREAVALQDRQAVCVYDQHEMPLFSGQVAARQPPTASQESFYSIEESKQTAYAYRSGQTGLLVVNWLANSEIMPGARSTLAVALPYLAVMVVVIVLLSLYLIWTIYKPVQDVVYTMATAGHPQKKLAGKNELDFIRTTYQDSEQKNTLLSELLSEVAPAVTEQIFRALISDAPPSEETVRNTLQSVASPFPMDGRYIVLFLQLRRPQSGEPPGLDAEIGSVWLMGLCRSYWQDRAQSHFLALPDNICVAILSFDSDVPKSKTKFLIDDFEGIVQNQTRDLPFQWDMGVGKLHIGIMEVRASCLEAREMLSRALYYREAVPEIVPANAPDSAYFSGRMRQIARFAAEGRMDDALAGLSIISDLTGQCSGAAGDSYRIGGDMLDALIEEMVRYHVDLDSLQLPRPEPAGSDPDALGRWERELQTFCRQALPLLQAAGQKGRNKHVESALKYIADNYTDTSLSQDEVSAHVGITSSYLSRIFADAVGCGFLDHLGQYRIDKARQLLVATDLQISEIGYQVGFSSSQSFTRVFKKLMGATPSAYRESLRRLNASRKSH